MSCIFLKEANMQSLSKQIHTEWLTIKKQQTLSRKGGLTFWWLGTILNILRSLRVTVDRTKVQMGFLTSEAYV